MATFSWKAAVIASMLLQVAFSAPQGISVYSSTDSAGTQHTVVSPLSQQQAQQQGAAIVAQHNAQNQALGGLFGGGLAGIGGLFSSLFGGGLSAPVAPVAPVAPARPAPAAVPAAPARIALNKAPSSKATGGGVVATYSTDSAGHTQESVQHLNAQQAQQLFLENQQKLQQLFASNPFNPFFNPWLLPPLPAFPQLGFPYTFPFLPAFAYLPAALAANANNIVATANQAAVNNAARSREVVDNVASNVASRISAATAAISSATSTTKA